MSMVSIIYCSEYNEREKMKLIKYKIIVSQDEVELIETNEKGTLRIGNLAKGIERNSFFGRVALKTILTNKMSMKIEPVFTQINEMSMKIEPVLAQINKMSMKIEPVFAQINKMSMKKESAFAQINEIWPKLAKLSEMELGFVQLSEVWSEFVQFSEVGPGLEFSEAEREKEDKLFQEKLFQEKILVMYGEISRIFVKIMNIVNENFKIFVSVSYTKKNEIKVNISIDAGIFGSIKEHIIKFRLLNEIKTIISCTRCCIKEKNDTEQKISACFDEVKKNFEEIGEAKDLREIIEVIENASVITEKEEAVKKKREQELIS